MRALKSSSGSIRNNYLPEPSTFFFWQNWKEGQNFETAVTSAYRKAVNAMNDAVRSFIDGLAPGLGALAGELVDFQKMGFVAERAGRPGPAHRHHQHRRPVLFAEQAAAAWRRRSCRCPCSRR